MLRISPSLIGQLFFIHMLIGQLTNVVRYYIFLLLPQENDDVKLRDKKQRQQIEILEHNEKELAKKNLSNQKIIRMLTEKTKGLFE